MNSELTQRLEEAALDEELLYRKRTRLAVTGVIAGGILLTLASFYTVRLEHRAEKARDDVRKLKVQEEALRFGIERLKTATKRAVDEKKLAEGALEKVKTNLRQADVEIRRLDEQRRAGAEAVSQGAPSPGEVTADEKKAIESLVEGLYAQTPSARGRAYNELMKKFRYQPFVIETVIKRAKKELDQPRSTRDVDGLYNSLVTLTDLSRQIIQVPPYKAQITVFAGEVATEMPGLQKRADILIKWLNTPSHP